MGTAICFPLGEFSAVKDQLQSVCVYQRSPRALERAQTQDMVQEQPQQGIKFTRAMAALPKTLQGNCCLLNFLFFIFIIYDLVTPGRVRNHLDVCRDGNYRNIWQIFVNPCQARGAETELRQATSVGEDAVFEQ